MTISKKKSLILLIISFIIIFILFLVNNYYKEEKYAQQPILINLLTSVHPNLDWNFEPVQSKISVKPGDVNTIEYIIENLSNQDSTGIATFVYFPNKLGDYIRKINCFCYDAQTLKPKEKNKFTLVLLIDPEVTKDSKTKNIKEATIQFTFFDYKEYKKKKS